MKPGTKVWVGLRHVGDADWPDQIAEMTAKESCTAVIELILKNSLAKRMEMVIARTRQEVEDRLNERRGGVGSRQDNESVYDEFSKMIAELGGDL